jgi:CheY-like chemotaxis protein
LGYNIIEAADGEEGLRLAVALPKPNLIILDILLPKLNGHQLLQELRKNNLTKSIPTVILTNDDSEKSFKKALKNGAPAYFAKDHTTLKEVGKIVQYHLGVLA